MRARPKTPPASARRARLTLEAQNGVTGLVAAFGPITLREQRRAPNHWKRAVRSYLNGEYRAGAQRARAADRTAPTVPLQVHAHVVRAAALYALFVRSGESDAQLRTDALAEIARNERRFECVPQAAESAGVFGPGSSDLCRTVAQRLTQSRSPRPLPSALALRMLFAR